MDRNSFLYKIFSLIIAIGLLLAACGAPATPTTSPTEMPSGTVEAPSPTLMEVTEATIAPTETDTPPTATLAPAITDITIDGDPSDWVDREVLLDDPAGDAEDGFLDLTTGYAFVNQNSLYFLVETVDPEEPFVQFDLEFQADNRRLLISWSSGQPEGFIGDVTSGYEQVGPTTDSIFALGFALEGRVDLGDMGSPESLNLTQIRVMVGECCEYPAWHPADEWNPGDTPVVNEIDPSELASAVEDEQTVEIPVNVTTSGFIFRDEIWRDEIHITGDINIDPNATLTIEPGTTVYLASFSDDQHGGQGWADEYVLSHEDPTGQDEWVQNAISIWGRIVAIGTPEAPITFTTDGDSDSTAQWDAIIITGGALKYCLVENTHIGVNIQGPGVEVAHCTVRNNLWVGVDIHAPDAWVHHNQIFGGGHHTIGVFDNNATIEHNIITAGQQGISGEGGDGVVVQNNLFLDNATGINIGPGSEQFAIVNNTFVRLSGPPDGWHFQGTLIYPSGLAGPFGIHIFKENATDIIINNIIAGPRGEGISIEFPLAEEAQIDHNLVWGSTRANFRWPPGFMQSNNVAVDPLFVDPENGDFHLQPESPAIDAGFPDLLDPDGSISDLGAYGGPAGEW